MPGHRLGIDVPTCHRETASLTEMSEMIANAHPRLGVRICSLIFAQRRGTPVLPVIYGEKMRQLLVRFPGVGELWIGLKALAPEALRDKLVSRESKRGQRITEITGAKDALYQEAKASLDETAARINSHA